MRKPEVSESYPNQPAQIQRLAKNQILRVPSLDMIISNNRIEKTLIRLRGYAGWSPAGKGLTSWLSFVVSTVSLSLSHWYPWSGVVLDCIDF